MRTHERTTDVRGASTAVIGLVAAALLGGCATSFDPSLYSGGHLQARIYQPTSGALQFAVSQPAYAAVFAIVPGRGATLLYPSTPGEAQRRLSPGTHSYVGSRLTYGRLTYASGLGSFHGSSVGGPTTLILIASEAPLRVSRLIRQPAFAGDLRLGSIYSQASEHVVGRLAELIIPDPASTNWTYDTYTLWPEERGRQVAAYRVRCADGQVVLVVRGVYPVGCREPEGQAPPPPPADTSAGPADTGRVDPPRRPVRPSEKLRKKPGSSAAAQTREAKNSNALSTREAKNSNALSRPRSGPTRDSQPRAREAPQRAAPPARVQAAPSRERQQAQPARQRPTGKSERSDRAGRAPPAS